MKHLALRVHSGLGNRIRALVAARRFAKLSHRTLSLIWEMNPYHLWCPYQRLFATPILESGTEFVQSANSLASFVIEGKGPLRVPVEHEAEILYVWQENFWYTTNDEGVMFGQFGPDKMRNSSLRDELLGEFQSLLPSYEVSREVKAFTDAELDGTVVGVHVRREDNVWSNAHCADRHFVAQMGRELRRSDCRFLVATDSDESYACLKRTFGNLVFQYPVRSTKRCDSQEAVIDAFTTLLLLSKTRLIIRSSSSSFSQVASWFGRVPTVEIGRLEHSW